MIRITEEELREVIPTFFDQNIELLGCDMVEANCDENGLLADTILFTVQHNSEQSGILGPFYQEVFIVKIDWDEQQLGCAITVADYETIRPKRYAPVKAYVPDNIVTLNNGTKSHKTIKKNGNGGVVEVIDSFKPVSKS